MWQCIYGHVRACLRVWERGGKGGALLLEKDSFRSHPQPLPSCPPSLGWGTELGTSASFPFHAHAAFQGRCHSPHSLDPDGLDMVSKMLQIKQMANNCPLEADRSPLVPLPHNLLPPFLVVMVGSQASFIIRMLAYIPKPGCSPSSPQTQGLDDLAKAASPEKLKSSQH